MAKGGNEVVLSFRLRALNKAKETAEATLKTLKRGSDTAKQIRAGIREINAQRRTERGRAQLQRRFVGRLGAGGEGADAQAIAEAAGQFGAFRSAGNEFRELFASFSEGGVVGALPDALGMFGGIGGFALAGPIGAAIGEALSELGGQVISRLEQRLDQKIQQRLDEFEVRLEERRRLRNFEQRFSDDPEFRSEQAARAFRLRLKEEADLAEAGVLPSADLIPGF